MNYQSEFEAYKSCQFWEVGDVNVLLWSRDGLNYAEVQVEMSRTRSRFVLLKISLSFM